jgi:hypothetical protein
MPAQTAFATVFLALAAAPALVQAKAELTQRKGSLRATVDVDKFQSNLQDALGELLGCGEDSRHEHLADIEGRLLPIWNSLPKSSNGRVERRLLRYVAHRYFMGTSAIMLRGFEPSRPASQSLVGAADILSQRVPALLEAALESQHAQDRGFDLHDAVHLVAALRKLVSDSDAALLEKVYQNRSVPTSETLSRADLVKVLEDYMILWLLGDDQETIEVFLADRSRPQEDFPNWDDILHFAAGQIRALDFRRRGSGLAQRYSFADAHRVVRSITESFASFWNSECVSMKEQLEGMDLHHTGRVPLSRFYSQKLSDEWRFAESEGYLRQLGALDETSRWHGKEVIIPNYIGAASNCIVATSHYLVCCEDACEEILGRLEAGVGAPVASADELLSLVGNITLQTSLDTEEVPHLHGSLRRQLDQIAASHGGRIPLHGRLFAQWLHYAFPRECPFPHMSGATTQLSPTEFGDYVVSENDRVKHSVINAGANVTVEKEDLQWMSQWSSEEELIANYADLGASSGMPWVSIVGAAALAVASASGVVRLGGSKSAASGSLLPMHSKTHLI